MPHHVASPQGRPSHVLTHLSCTSCGLHHDWTKLQNLCTACRKPLFAVYTSNKRARAQTQETGTRAEKSLSRYRDYCRCRLIPRRSHLVKKERLCFAQESSAPLCECRILDQRRITGSDSKFQGARDVRRRFDGKHLGASRLVAPSAGNAASALAAYAARAGVEAHVFMPRDTPRANISNAASSVPA